MPCFFFVRLRARCSRTSCTFRAPFSPSATCAPCFAFGQRFTRDNTALRVLVFLDSCHLLFGNSSLCNIAVYAQTSTTLAFSLSCCSCTSVYTALRVLVFLDSCHLLFGNSSLCNIAVYAQTKHNSAFSLSGCGRGAHVRLVRSAPRSRLPRLVRLASRLVNVLQEITCQIQMSTTKARQCRAF